MTTQDAVEALPMHYPDEPAPTLTGAVGRKCYRHDWRLYVFDTGKQVRCSRCGSIRNGGSGMSNEAPTLIELERTDPFSPHDPGCNCWPHVSQRQAVEAATQAALREYREAKRTPSAVALLSDRVVVEVLGEALHRATHKRHPWSGCANPDHYYVLANAAIKALTELVDPA